MKNSLKGISIVAVAGLMLAGCSSSGGDNARNEDGSTTLTMGVGSIPPMLDTVTTTYTPTGWMMRSVVETLITSDSDYNIQPMLADSWEASSDGLSIVFHLRDGVKFHNGETMDADDVVASMQRWNDHSAQGLTAMPGAVWEKTDESTVAVTMQEPNAVAPLVLAGGGANIAAIYPKEIVEAAGSDPITDFVGTGPYTLAEYKPDEKVTLERFGDYSARSETTDGLAGDRTGNYDKIDFLAVSDAQARIGGALTGQYDITDIALEDYQQIVGAEDLEPVTNFAGSLYLNYNKKMGAMSELGVREAANAAIGSESVMQAVGSDPELFKIRSGIMQESQEALWHSDVDDATYNMNNPELAKEMLAKTDYDGSQIRLLTQQGDKAAKAAVVVQQQLEAAGFATDLTVIDPTSYFNQRDVPAEWDILVAGMNSKLEPAAMTFFTPQFAGWTDDPTLSDVLTNYRNSESVEDAASKYGDILAAYDDYRPMTKIADWADLLAVKKGLESATVHDSHIVFWSVPLLDD